MFFIQLKINPYIYPKTLTPARVMCHPYLAGGELIELFPDMPRKQWTAYIYRPQRNITPPRVKLVFDLLGDILKERLVLG
jgi:DNA-binding transcriptional LysR family regulator